MVRSSQPQSVVHTLTQGTVGANSRSRKESVSRGNEVREERKDVTLVQQLVDQDRGIGG